MASRGTGGTIATGRLTGKWTRARYVEPVEVIGADAQRYQWTLGTGYSRPVSIAMRRTLSQRLLSAMPSGLGQSLFTP